VRWASSSAIHSVGVGRFGRYLLLEPLGRGGMGDVHLARRDGADKSCVLKLLRIEHRENAAQLSRLKREAQVLSYLDHPHVGRILDAGVENGVFYLALEYIDSAWCTAISPPTTS
jgi:eukaryotic-like serine/threonine-protein kinase